MTASLIKALTVLIAIQLIVIVAVLVIDIVILKNQNNAADTTTNANSTSSFSTTKTKTEGITTTPTIDTTTSTLSSTPPIVSSTSVTSSAIDTTTTAATTTESEDKTTTLTYDTNTLTQLSASPIVSSTASVPPSTIDTTTTTTTTPTKMTDCYDWRLIGATMNGIYQINPGYGLEPFDVYCDMITDGGGWTVIQRRVDDSLEFWNNNWQQYKNGFNNGIDNGNLWLGNDRIHVMSQWNVTLRVEINGNRWPHPNPNYYLYGTYNFSISDENTNYTLYISLPIEGNASNANETTYGFISNNKMPFSTVDKSSNQFSHCVSPNQFSAWWFNGDLCTDVALNGKYNPTIPGHGFRWHSRTDGIILPNRSEMKIRRQQ